MAEISRKVYAPTHEDDSQREPDRNTSPSLPQRLQKVAVQDQFSARDQHNKDPCQKQHRSRQVEVDRRHQIAVKQGDYGTS